MKKTTLLLAIGAALMAPLTMAADIEAGKSKAVMCAGCHGADGIAINPEWPNLKGQNDKYVIAQLKAFKDGTRKNPLMTPMATGLTDEDMVNLAAYFKSLK